MRILFFIGSLRSGGKERRLVELLTYLKQKGNYELFVVLIRGQIDYPTFEKLEINYKVLNKKHNFKDPRIFFTMNDIFKKFKPHIIHTWGSMETFYAVLSSLFLFIPIVSSEITDALPKRKLSNFQKLVIALNFRFAKIITSNSKAGLYSYNLKESSKFRVVYNGINLERFNKLQSKEIISKNYNLKTKYAVVMVASFTHFKDYTKYLDLCSYVGEYRKDISFFAVGDGVNLNSMIEKAKSELIDNIIFTGRISNVEELITVCDIGVLFSPYGESISNSIIEYMALGKPVIATEIGGTNEIVQNCVNGYLIKNESIIEIADLLIDLIDNTSKRYEFGRRSKEIIKDKFLIEHMGASFERLYDEFVHPVRNVSVNK